jgi:hypothetical protein
MLYHYAKPSCSIFLYTECHLGHCHYAECRGALPRGQNLGAHAQYFLKYVLMEVLKKVDTNFE